MRPAGFPNASAAAAGRHIRDCSGHPRAKPRRYFQKRLTGARYSIGAVLMNQTGGLSSFAASKQWTSPSSTQSYRFGGCVSKPAVDQALLAELTRIAGKLATALHLVGMASFDFIVEQDFSYLLEVNPRPGASLDVLDDAGGNLFRGHTGRLGRNVYRSPWTYRPASKAIAILHADRGAVTLRDTPWPDWSADRGAPGTFVPPGAPACNRHRLGPDGRCGRSPRPDTLGGT